MVTAHAVLKCFLVPLSAATIALTGCLNGTNGSSWIEQVDARNQSTNDLRFVAVVSEGITNEFGFLDAEVGHKTSMSCQFRPSPVTLVIWEENGQKLKATIDTAKYASHQRIVKGLSFIYQGNGEWRFIARSGTDEDSPEVTP